MTDTPRLHLPLLAEAQDSPDIPINLGRYEVDALLQGSVISRVLSSPPGGEVEGAAYIVAAPGSGAWAGHSDQIAAFQGGGYRFYEARVGWRIWCESEALALRFGVGSPSTWTPDSGSEFSVGLPGSPSFLIPGVSKILFDNAEVTDLGDGTVLVVPSADAGQSIELQIACSDMTTALTTGISKAYLRAPTAFTLDQVRASLAVVSSSGAPVIDINKNGATILSTKLTIDASEKTSVTAATPAVISDSAIGDDDELTIDIDTAGTGAAGLIVTLIGTR